MQILTNVYFIPGTRDPIFELSPKILKFEKNVPKSKLYSVEIKKSSSNPP